MRFAQKVKTARMKAGKSRKALANEVSRSVRTIKAWELGETMPDQRTCRRLEVILNIASGSLGEGVADVDHELTKFVECVMSIGDDERRLRVIRVVSAMTDMLR